MAGIVHNPLEWQTRTVNKLTEHFADTAMGEFVISVCDDGLLLTIEHKAKRFCCLIRELPESFSPTPVGILKAKELAQWEANEYIRKYAKPF